jgi:hypothetical protein
MLMTFDSDAPDGFHDSANTPGSLVPSDLISQATPHTWEY